MKLFLSLWIICCLTITQKLKVTDSWLVKGRLVSNDDSPNTPLPGFTITIHGSTKGTVTDINGYFELTVTEQDFGGAKELTIVIDVSCFQQLRKVITKQHTDLGTINISNTITILGAPNSNASYSAQQSIPKKVWAGIKGFPKWITKPLKK